jgi:hypothetical protein
MKTTMQLLTQALKIQRATRWAEELDVDVSTISQAKRRGHLTPAIAGAIADRLGQDPKTWIVISALEGEKESTCKAHLLRKITSL